VPSDGTPEHPIGLPRTSEFDYTGLFWASLGLRPDSQPLTSDPRVQDLLAQHPEQKKTVMALDRLLRSLRSRSQNEKSISETKYAD
jgi:hypothetical protein